MHRPTELMIDCWVWTVSVSELSVIDLPVCRLQSLLARELGLDLLRLLLAGCVDR